MAEATRTEQITTNIPEWAKPFAAQLFGRVFGAPETGIGGLLAEPYRQYEGQMVAGFNPLQQAAFSDLAAMGISPQTLEASGLASLIGRRAGELGQYQAYQPGQFYQSPAYQGMDLDYLRMQGPQATSYQMGPTERVSGAGYGPLGMGPTERVGAREYGPLSMGPAERVGVNPLTTFQIGGPERVGAERFGAGAMREYMSPYMQGVVEQQKQGAVRDYMRQLPGLGASAARSGALGGSRQAILESEARRGLAERLGDIEATGLQSAYQQAASQFGQDRAAQMQAALANQAAGLTTGQQNLAAALGVQQLGSQQGLQAALANQQAGLTVGQQNLAAEQARQQFLGQTGLQAALANQQMGFNVGQQNLAAEQARQQFMGQSGLQAALANQQAGMQAGQQNLQALINQAQFGASQAMQAGQLNQAAQLQAQAQALQQRQAMNQFNQQNAQFGAQYGLAGAQLGEASRQFGANLGLQGLAQQLGAAQALGGFGQQQYQQGLGISQAQLGAGQQIQGVEQQQMQAQYQDFLNRMQFPYRQLEFASGILRGFQPTGQTTTLYQPGGSTMGGMFGTGLGLAGLFGGLGG